MLGPLGGKKDAQRSSPDSEENAEAMALEEYRKLSRQLYFLENDKRAYLEDSNGTIKNQKKMIERLEKENEKLDQELKAFSFFENKKGEADLKKLFDLLHHEMKLRSKVKREEISMNQFKKKLSASEMKVNSLKLKLEGESRDHLTEELNTRCDEKEYILNKKLETVTKRFDAAVLHNKTLRESIEEIMKENFHIVDKSNRLRSALRKHQKAIDQLMDEAISAYDEREEAMAKVNALEEREEKERKQYNTEINELNRIIRHEEKLFDFMATKNKDRIFLETDLERQRRLESAKETSKDDAVAIYKEHFKKLLLPGCTTFEHLPEEYSNLWKENVTKFGFITELKNKNEKLQAEIESLRESIKLHSSETVEKNKEQNLLISENEKVLQNMEKEREHCDTELKESTKAMSDVIKLIRRVFQITDLNENVPVLDLLGRPVDIDDENVLIFLNILESRIPEIMRMKPTEHCAIEEESGRSSCLMPGTTRSSFNESTQQNDLSAYAPTIIVSDDAENAEIIGDDNREEEKESIVGDERTPLRYSKMKRKILQAPRNRSRSLSPQRIQSEFSTPSSPNSDVGGNF